MKASELGERELIRQVVMPYLGRHEPEWLGDDCGVLPIDEQRSILITTDAGPMHTFLRSLQIGSFVDLGHYFATMTLSDIAAMGGRPRALLAAFIFDSAFSVESFDELLNGLTLACEEVGARFIGGDTKEGSTLRVVTTGVGIIETRTILTRRGAQPRDLVCISGKLGTALRSYIKAARQERVGTISRVHRPRARIDFGASLARDQLATSCIDISDGPLAAARELAELNNCVLNLDIDSLGLESPPFHEIPAEEWRTLILNVGGDFELMFTTRPKNREKIEALGGTVCGMVLEASGKPGIKIMGSGGPVPVKSWENFRSTERITNTLVRLV